jgi:hypothetical protein
MDTAMVGKKGTCFMGQIEMIISVATQQKIEQ